MLERTTHPNGIVTYQSPLLRAAGITHAFSTRIGGTSPAPYDSLNFGNPSVGPPDLAHNIQENFRRLQHALHADHMRRASVRQVHGNSIEILSHEQQSEYAETLAAELRDRFAGQTPADGILTSVPNVLLTIRTADCVPVLLASHNGIVAALHAGWRGVISGIVENGIAALRANPPHFPNAAHRDTNSAHLDILAAIGPGISGVNFEVGEEVAAAFEKRDLALAITRPTGQKPHVDLQKAIAEILRRNGVNHIDGNDLCTFRDRAEFFSHRRDAGRTGRMVALLAARYNRPP
jgi:polyphenol oxidase